MMVAHHDEIEVGNVSGVGEVVVEASLAVGDAGMYLNYPLIVVVLRARWPNDGNHGKQQEH